MIVNNEDNDKEGNKMNYIGWLSPKGEHFKCGSFCHDSLTRKILNDYYKINSYSLTAFEIDDALFNRGWCRIGYQSMLDRGYVIQTKWRYITEEQKVFIKNMFFDSNIKMTERTIDYLMTYDIIENDKGISKVKKNN